MSSQPITGTLTAMITPFRDGQVSTDELKQLVEHQISNGISGLVPVGTTGESPTLSYEGDLKVISTVVQAANKRIPVIAGTGSNSTAEAVRLTKQAHEAGVDGVLQVAPYYNKPSPEGLYRHFASVAEITDRPIILYSIPSRCVIDIPVSTVERLRANYANIRYIKESGGSCERVDQLKQALGDDITILSGDDSLTLPFMSVGAKGVISVASNLFPNEVSQMVAAALQNDFVTATNLHLRLSKLFKVLFIEPNPVPVKTAMKEIGLITSDEVRLPLCEMTPENRAELIRVVEELNS
jgi:4-hydroxy-tetrahydrodipicolinate synthase